MKPRLSPFIAAISRLATLCFAIIFITTQATGQIEIDAGGLFEVCTDSLFDSGGALDGYGPNESHVVTLCPEDSTSVLWIEWSLFSLDESSSLMVYDGDSEEAAVLALGTLSQLEGSAFYPSSSNASGCLTISFLSGAGASGDFQAFVHCADPCLEPVLEDAFLCLEDPGMVASFSFDALGVDPPWVTYQWMHNGNVLAGAESSPLVTDDVGVYCVTISSSVCEAPFDESDCAFLDAVHPFPELTPSYLDDNLDELQMLYPDWSIVWVDGQTYSLGEILWDANNHDNLNFTVQDPYGCFDDVAYNWPNWLSIEEHVSGPILAFPNPCDGILHLSSKEDLVQVNIFNLQGQQVASIVQPGASIDIGWLPLGCYILSFVPKTGLPTSCSVVLK